MQGFESSALGRSQILGQMEAGDVRQGLAESVQGALERSGLRRGGGALVLLGRQLPERIGEQPSPVGLVGDTECGDQAQRLVCGNFVLLDGREQVVLLLGRERHKRGGQRGTDGAVGELVRGLGPEPRGQRQAALDPVALAAQEMDNGSGREVVIVN